MTYAERCRRADELARMADRTGEIRYLLAAMALHWESTRKEEDEWK